MNEIKIFSPASVANISCGFDVLGVCLNNIGDEMVIRKTKKKGVVISKVHGDIDIPLDNKKNVAAISAASLLNKISINHGFEIEIFKGIKSGSGIGSSAASSAGSVFGINKLIEKPFSKNELIKFAMEGEKKASGTAHADNVAPLIYGGITLIRSTTEIDVINLPIPDKLFLTIIHPKIKLKTSDSRSILKHKVSLKKTIDQMANLGGFISGLYTNDFNLIKRSLKDVIVEPTRSILIPEFYKIKKSAIDSGALGSGIAGSGPSVYAMVKGEKKAKKVGEAMSEILIKIGLEFNLHVSEINRNGIKVLSKKWNLKVLTIIQKKLIF